MLAALQGLEGKYRAPLVLYYLDDHSYREIATTLDLPVGTITSRFSRGKDMLRQRLEDDRLGGFVRQYGQFSKAEDRGTPKRVSAAKRVVRYWQRAFISVM